jgi:hypothetical protein
VFWPWCSAAAGSVASLEDLAKVMIGWVAVMSVTLSLKPSARLIPESPGTGSFPGVHQDHPTVSGLSARRTPAECRWDVSIARQGRWHNSGLRTYPRLRALGRRHQSLGVCA